MSVVELVMQNKSFIVDEISHFRNNILHINIQTPQKHTLWLDPCNFLNTSRPAWSSLTTFPLSIYLPIHHRNRVKASFKNNFKYKHLSEEALSLQVSVAFFWLNKYIIQIYFLNLYILEKSLIYFSLFT